MLLSLLYGLIGILLLTAFCLAGAFLVPQDAYWFMTPSAVEQLEKYGIPRELIWMTSIFDAIVLDWWMFTKTDIFGILIKTKTGKTPDVMRVDPQWDGYEVHKLIVEIVISVILALIFIKVC